MPKPIGSIVTLHWVEWNGPAARPGDALRTTTGRRYEIIEATGRKLKCRVIHEDARLIKDAREFTWTWSIRKRK